MKTINIKFNNEIRKVELRKLIFILSKLENDENLVFKSFEQIEELMLKYGLYDDEFLDNINSLW